MRELAVVLNLGVRPGLMWIEGETHGQTFETGPLALEEAGNEHEAWSPLGSSRNKLTI